MVTVDCWGADPRSGPGPILQVVMSTPLSEPATDVPVPVADPLFGVGGRTVDSAARQRPAQIYRSIRQSPAMVMLGPAPEPIEQPILR
jgi:hypothetical protein